MATNIGLPSLTISFQSAARAAANRSKRGYAGVFVRDAQAQGVHQLSSAALIPATLGADNQAYLQRTFLGYVNPPKKVIAYTTDEEDTNLAQALAYMATQEFDYLVGPADCSSTEAAAIATWVDSQRTNNGTKFKAVLPNQASDKYPIVNFAATGMTDGTDTYTTAEYCSRIAGVLAGTPMKISATFAPLPELTDVDRLTRDELDAAVNAGKLALKWDGRKVKVARAVNSFVTTSQGMLDSFKKIKIVEIMDLIRTDITATAEDSYIGKYANTYDNKLLLVTAIRGYFMGLEQDDLVQPGYTVDIDVDAQEQWLTAQGVDTSELTEQEIREADTGSHVFLLVRCKILDAIEDIDIQVEI